MIGNQADAMRFGPWTLNITAEERRARFRSLRMCVILMFRGANLIDALLLAEDDVEWSHRARAELMRLPALHRRKILASYANLFGRRA
jgi:hypothetical protein